MYKEEIIEIAKRRVKYLKANKKEYYKLDIVKFVCKKIGKKQTQENYTRIARILGEIGNKEKETLSIKVIDSSKNVSFEAKTELTDDIIERARRAMNKSYKTVISKQKKSYEEKQYSAYIARKLGGI